MAPLRQLQRIAVIEAAAHEAKTKNHSAREMC
jgi:hypothetical protein